MNDTHEEYVSEEIAKLLKEAGFDWGCYAHYQNGVFNEFSYSSYFKVLVMNFNGAPDYMNQQSAPSLHVAQEWLRTLNYHVDVFADCDSNGVFFHARWLHLQKPERFAYLVEEDDRYFISYKTHKEALEAVILFVLKQYIKERDEKKD